MRRSHFEARLAERFALVDASIADGVITSGELVRHSDQRRFPVRASIPRFVEDDGYGASFGLQWHRFRTTQLDSVSGRPLSFNRFWNDTQWKPKPLFGREVLECGSGAGRFTEVLLDAGARVVSFDLTSAVDANWENNRDKGDLFLVQADLDDLPFAPASFPYVFCFGVLQHTPDPLRAFRSLLAMVAPGGELVLDHYLRTRWPTPWSTPKYLWRPLTTRMDPELLLRVVRAYIPWYLPFDTVLRRVPRLGPLLLALLPVPCWNYTRSGLSREQRREWAVLDTFDALSAAYDQPKTLEEVKALVHDLDNEIETVTYGANGVVARIRRRSSLGASPASPAGGGA
jgi:SAM-dependent methyltransferase